MRRVVFKIGWVNEQDAGPTSLKLSAAAEPEGRPRDHWFTLSSKVKTIASVLGVAALFVTHSMVTSSRLAVLEDAHKTVVKRADLQAEQINRLRDTTLTRDQYWTDRAQQNAVNLQLANNQQQVLLLLARNAGGK